MGPDGVTDQRHGNGREPYLNEEQQTDFWEAIQGPAPDGGLWTAPKIASWTDEKAGYKGDDHTDWLYLRRLGYTRQSPRQTHPQSDEKAGEAFKMEGFKGLLMGSFETIPAPKSRSGRKMKPASGCFRPTDACGPQGLPSPAVVATPVRSASRPPCPGAAGTAAIPAVLKQFAADVGAGPRAPARRAPLALDQRGGREPVPLAAGRHPREWGRVLGSRV